MQIFAAGLLRAVLLYCSGRSSDRPTPSHLCSAIPPQSAVGATDAHPTCLARNGNLPIGEAAGYTQTELAKKAGTTQSVIARLEDAEYTGHSLTMLERIAAACGVALKLRAEKKPHFDREVALV